MANVKLTPEQLEIMRRRGAARRMEEAPSPPAVKTQAAPTVDLSPLTETGAAVKRLAAETGQLARIVAERLAAEHPAPVSYTFTVVRDARGLIQSVRADPVLSQEDE